MESQWSIPRSKGPTLIILLLLIPMASASNPWQADLQISSAHAGQDSSMDATLRFFSARPLTTIEASLPADFLLHAQQVRVELDRADVMINSAVSRHGTEYHTTVTEFSQGQIAGLENRDFYRLLVVPLEGQNQVHVESHCGDISSSPENAVERHGLASSPANRPSLLMDTADALTWQDCASFTPVRVTGDFLLVLWDWDFQVKDASGVQEFQTGQEQHPALEGLPDASSVVSQDREAWVFVTNGTLSFSLVAGAQHSLYTGADASVHSESGFLFEGATGSIRISDQEKSVEDAEVGMQGVLDAALENRRDGLSSQVAGQLTRLSIDSEPRWTANTQVPSAPSDSWWLLAAGVTVLALLGGFTFAPQAYYRSLQAAEARRIHGLPGDSWRQRQGSAFTIMARNANQRDQPTSALAIATLAMWFNDHPQARIAMAKAYKRLGWTRSALRVHERLDHVLTALPKEQARNAWHAHRVAQGAGRQEEADKWLDLARNRDPIEFLHLSHAWPEHRDALAHDAAFT